MAKSSIPTIGILGAGQLGKMLAIAGHPMAIPIYMLDAKENFPGGPLSTKFFQGNFNNYDDVIAFGEHVDILTVEIEHVNIEALQYLKKQGKTIHPDPDVLSIIKDKGLQKQFYEKHQLPTSDFTLYDSGQAVKQAIADGNLNYPFVQKSRGAGYDGKGVAVIKDASQIDRLLEAPCVVEPLVDIDKEIAVIVARNPSGQIKNFEPVEMEFHPTANLVEFLFCPSKLTESQKETVTKLAHQVIDAYQVCGLLAVEFFLTKSGEWLVNEVAPRPHNSGHHTIESAVTSQFEQHLRAILDYPLGDTTEHLPAVMINLLGAEGHTGPAHYDGMQACLEIPGAHLHLYGKEVTKPFRKMGHATVVDKNLDLAIEKARTIKKTLNIISHES